jgi:methylenetetrahydrofolate dehydrogenase (NADP+)/methenyltetrahydrofolate cyclohydrolase
MTTIINGKSIAQDLRASLATSVAELKAQHGLVPGLAVVLVGEDPASQVYVRNKARQTVEVGMNSFEHKLPADTTEVALLGLIEQLNADETVHGILVQLPLPDHIEESRIINAVSHDKDVDGFHLVNVGRLNTDGAGVVPCTPLGCLMMLKATLGDLSGKNAVIVGRSNIVGKPMAALLLKENCTVTIAHSRTQNLESLCQTADILVAAVGRPQMVSANWIKPGAAVIDVGINRIEENGKSRLVGDVDFDSAAEVAGAITPVPGGVGPMTIACLLHNTLQQAKRIHGIDT